MNTTQELTLSSRTHGGVLTTAGLDGLLHKQPLLQGLSQHQFQLLKDCAMVVNFQAGELIFREGDPANRFYLINRGKIALESFVQEKGTTLIQMLGAGDVLGWSWLFEPYYWHFDARAVEPTEAIFFYATPLREECEADHELGYELIKRMSEVMLHRLQATRRQLLDLNKCPCPGHNSKRN